MRLRPSVNDTSVAGNGESLAESQTLKFKVFDSAERLARHPTFRAGGRLIAEYQEDMRRVCSYVLGESALAEEATQAAWVVAWKKIGTVRDPANLRPWLVSVAVNEAKQLLRKRHRGMKHKARMNWSWTLGQRHFEITDTERCLPQWFEESSVR